MKRAVSLIILSLAFGCLAGCEGQVTGTVSKKEEVVVPNGAYTSVHYQLTIKGKGTVDVSESVFKKCKKGNYYNGVKCTTAK